MALDGGAAYELAGQLHGEENDLLDEAVLAREK